VNALSLAWRASLASSNLTKKYLAPAGISKENIPGDDDANVGNKLVQLGATILLSPEAFEKLGMQSILSTIISIYTLLYQNHTQIYITTIDFKLRPNFLGTDPTGSSNQEPLGIVRVSLDTRYSTVISIPPCEGS
jgi:hypothetical protein